MFVAPRTVIGGSELLDGPGDGVVQERIDRGPSAAARRGMISSVFNGAPVILAFHGHGGNMYFAARGMTFQNQWPEAIVVYPQGLPTPGIILDGEGEKSGWQSGPGDQKDRDLAFFDAGLVAYGQRRRRRKSTGRTSPGE